MSSLLRKSCIFRYDLVDLAETVLRLPPLKYVKENEGKGFTDNCKGRETLRTPDEEFFKKLCRYPADSPGILTKRSQRNRHLNKRATHRGFFFIFFFKECENVEAIVSVKKGSDSMTKPGFRNH